MKKLLVLLLAAVMLFAVVPTTALARNAYIVYEPVDGCQMTAISFTKANNPWLLWDVNFIKVNGETVLQTEKDHPGLVGCEVIPSITFEGTSATFNGKPLVAGEAVTLKAENEIVIADTANHNYAEYTVLVTEESNGLPVVLIDTDGAEIATKTEYVDAEISVIGSETYEGKNFYSAVAGIKLRGNSTMGYAKKPYRIKFDKKQDVLGMGKAKSWVLLADYLDPSSLRNQVAFNLATRVNAFTAETTGFQVFAPRMKLVEVYLNGKFQGLYEMGDHMQANELRVAINELGDEENDDGSKPYNNGEEIGYFIEVEVESRVLQEGAEGYEDWSAYSYIENVGGTAQNGKLYFQFKLPEVPSPEQTAYITDYLQNVNDLILANDDAVWDLVDMDSLIDWYLVNELFKNADSQMQSSIYFFKDGTLDEDGNVKENPNTKLYMGPVWDFDLGAGGVSYGSMDDPTGWRTRNDEYCDWFRELFEMDSFKTAVDKRWADLHAEGILEAMYTDIESLEAFVSDAAKANYKLWHDTYIDEVTDTWMTVPAVSTDSQSWETQVDYFEAYLRARIDWMDRQFGYDNKEEIVLDTKSEAVDSLTFTAASNGNVSQTYKINKDVSVDELALELDMNSTAKWNFEFHYTVNAKINGENVTFALTPSTMNDWQSSGNVFDGNTGVFHAPGIYNDRVVTVSGALVWRLNHDYNVGASASNLADFITSLHLNSVKVYFESAQADDTATFSLKNTATDETALQIEKTVIIGKPSVMGDAKIGMTLFASNTEVLPYKATVTYQWYVDGVAISGETGNSYTATSDDFGKAITVKATGIGAYTGTVTSEPLTVGKYARTSTYNAPTLVEVTSNSITIKPETNVPEYSLDGVNWQASTTFTNLDPNTVYTVYVRAAETNTGAAGVISDPLVVTTLADETIKGDVNGNEKLDTTDATWVLDQALDFAVMSNETALELSDMNDDGKINTLDARLILKAIVNK